MIRQVDGLLEGDRRKQAQPERQRVSQVKGMAQPR